MRILLVWLVCLPVLGGAVEVDPTNDLHIVIPQLISAGVDTVHLKAGEYRVSTPIICDARKLHIFGHDAKIVNDIPMRSSYPVFFNITDDFLITGVTIDWHRTEWSSFSKLFAMRVPPWAAARLEHEGRTECTKTYCGVVNCTFFDSMNASKDDAPSGDPKRDNWVVACNDPQSNHRLDLIGNRCDLWDTELSGATWGWQTVRINHNVIRGGSTTGALIQQLTRWNGHELRRVQNLEIGWNLFECLTGNAIAVGYDAQSPINMKFDRIIIHDNVALVAPEPKRYVAMVVLKMQDFEGDIRVYNNRMIFDWTDPDYDVRPRGIVALNRLRRKSKPAGRLVFEKVIHRFPDGSDWRLTNGIRHDEFRQVVEQ